IASLKERNAPITVWGVGTRLVTGHDQPALGGVYKLSAVREPGGPWQHKVKLSEEIGKGSNPGLQQVRRYHSDQQFLADLIYDVERGVRPGGMMTDPTDPGKRRPLPAGAACTDLLEPVLRGGQAVEALPSTEQARGRTREQLGHLPAGVLSLQSPQTYPVGLEDGLQQLKADLICHCAARG
ncbi:MAG: nicotinate phosphoribosyltransferase, partial [Pedosphaera parvula]|nr:nicotinate phosphoribosyltransferase [Pedosphaera parvula]